MCTRALTMSLCVLLLLVGTVGAASSQALELASRGPRFIATWVTRGKVVDVSNAAVLRRRVSLDLTNVTADEALREITRQADLEISYSRSLLPTTKSVSLHARAITVAAALTEILLDAGVDVAVARTGHLALVRRQPAHINQPASDSSDITGRITDESTGAPLSGATVLLDGPRRNAITSAAGYYRISGVAPGDYGIQVRFIGYLPAADRVSVVAGAETRMDFALKRSIQQLDQVVVTGSVVPTEVKALPSPVSVITGEDIQRRQPRTTVQVFRQAVPSAVAWDFGADPEMTSMSVRGASALVPGSGSMKVFLDGIEITNHGLAAIDPNSIERIEVIRGPQAATVYGSDAIGGVMQVFTKRGDGSLGRPRLQAQAALGAAQSPYSAYGTGSALRQEYSASLEGGTPTASYNLGGGYTHLGDWAPEGKQSLPSAFSGIRFVQNDVTLDLSGRYYMQNTAAVSDPRLSETAYAAVTGPFFRPVRYQEQTFGAQLTYTPKGWWRHSLRVGIDRVWQDAASTRPRRAEPSDTFLIVLDQNRNKASIAYNTSVEMPVAQDVSAIVTAGLDHYTWRSDGYVAFAATNTTGTLQTPADQPPFANRSIVTNTGFFAQAQVAVHEALFLTGGLRAEQNSEFGADLGTPISPRVGVSYARRLGATNVKLRASYGEAIRPPGPGQKEASVSPFSVVLANPLLGPERQRGWDAGIDVAIGDRVSASATYYSQTADDLIDFVFVDPEAVTFQYQNVGRVKNTGLELEGRVSLGSAQLSAQYAITSGRIRDVGPNYTGDYRAGDRVWLVPRHTAGATVSFSPGRRTALAAGLTYVGSWTYYDDFAFFSCFGGTGPCQETNRDYLTRYPGFLKINLSVAQEITPGVSGFASIDNLTNNDDYEYSNSTPILGRVSMVGLRVRY